MLAKQQFILLKAVLDVNRDMQYLNHGYCQYQVEHTSI